MALDDRDYMKNRRNDPTYNPKEFRGSKSRFLDKLNGKNGIRAKSSSENKSSDKFSYRDAYCIPETPVSYKNRSRNNNAEVTWQTKAFGIPLNKLLFFIVLVGVCLFLFSNGFFDNVLNKFRSSPSLAQQGYEPAPVSFNPQRAPIPAPAMQQSVIAAASVTSSGAYSIPRSANGHFYVAGSVNNTPVVFLVDTGASMTMISSGMAFRAGITQCTKQEFVTAMGIDRDTCVAKAARLQFGKFYIENIEVGISKNLTGEALLGMSVLRNLKMAQIGDKLVLESPN